MLPKIAALRQLCDARGLAAHIEVDDGQEPGNAKLAIEAGADVLTAGTSIFGSDDYAKAIANLRDPR
jgi:ribulose-phosphate 3-epimerase